MPLLRWLTTLLKMKSRGTLNSGATFCKRLARTNRDTMRRTLCLSPGELTAFNCFSDGTRWWILTIYWQEEGPENPLPAERSEERRVGKECRGRWAREE